MMQNDPSAAAPAEPEGKRCAACCTTKSADQFYVSRGRLSAYCKACQRAKSAAAYRRRRSEPTERARMRALDRQRKRAERARLARTDSDRERRRQEGRDD